MGTEFDRLIAFIQDRTGLTVDDNRQQDVQRVIQAMLRAGGLPDMATLAGQLTAAPLTHDLWRDLINAITIGETYFFRNGPQFNALRDHVLPDLIARKRSEGRLRLRLWSAGCATGEEPYSLAMLLMELLPDLLLWDILLLATDIDTVSLDKARRGVFRASSFRNETPEAIRDRWFTRTADGFLLDRAVRERVTFAPLNLIDDVYPAAENNTADMDMVICRNVTIYFAEAVTREVVRRFNACLDEGGWLIVGHSEPMATIYEDQGFVPRNFENTVLYRKDTEAARAHQNTFRLLFGLGRADAPSAPEAAPLPPLPPAEPPRARPLPAAVPVLEAAADPELLQAAREAGDRGQWDVALELCARLIERDPMAPYPHYLKGLIFIYMDDLNAALHALRQSIYCEPSFALAQYSLGDLYQKRHNDRLAARHWRLALDILGSLEPDAHLWFSEDLTAEMLRGLILHRLDRLSAADREGS